MKTFAAGYILLLLFALCACATSEKVVTASAANGETVEVKASNFKFEPNHINAKKGDAIVLKIENISKTAHDFTLLGPRGNMIQDVDLPPNQVVTVKIDLTEPGIYHFHCDKDSHSLFGMKGQIEVK